MTFSHKLLIEKNEERGTADIYLDGKRLVGVSSVSIGEINRDTRGNPESVTITILDVSVDITSKGK